MTRFFRVLLLTFALFALLAVPAFAQAVTPPADPTDIKGWLDYLLAGGAGLVVTFLLSTFAERWPAWAALDTNVKFSVAAVLSSGLGLGAWAIVTYVPAETIVALRAPLSAVILSLSTFIGGQLYHRFTKAPAA